jgi:hypothetical protein
MAMLKFWAKTGLKSSQVREIKKAAMGEFPPFCGFDMKMLY